LESDILQLVLLALTGVLAGTVNTIAGGGSLLTLPALMLLGVSAPVANGTNRIAIVMQSSMGARAMHKRAPFPLRATFLLSIPTVIGAIAGAWLATRIHSDDMRIAIGCALVAGALLLAAQPKRLLEKRSREEGRSHPFLLVFGLLVAGFYGGLLQAGVGAVLLVVLGWVGRWDLLDATGAKNLMIAIYTFPALAIFVLADEVAWLPGLVLGVGAVVGAEFGARLALRGGRKLILGTVVIAVLVAALKLLGVLG